MHVRLALFRQASSTEFLVEGVEPQITFNSLSAFNLLLRFFYVLDRASCVSPSPAEVASDR
jgi:hypothetical protein